MGLGDSFGGESDIRYNGLIDELAIWNVALTGAEIAGHFLRGAEGYDLTFGGGCEETFDGVTIDGPGTSLVGETATLTATATGVDDGASASYSWELVSGVATLGATNAASLEIMSADSGEVVVRVSSGDGVCDDEANAEHSITFIGGAAGTSPEGGLLNYYSFDDDTIDDVAEGLSQNGGRSDDHLSALGLDEVQVPIEVDPRFVDGLVGRAAAIGVEAEDPLWLDGDITLDVDLAPTYTLECWIYPTELADSWQRILLRWGANGQAYHLAIRNNGANADGVPNINAVSLFHAHADGSIVNTDGGTVVLDEWQHIAGVADGERIRVYLNGIEVHSVPYSGTIAAPEFEGLGIGDFYQGNGLRYNGLIDEIAMWSTALTPEQLRSHYLAGPLGYGLTEGQGCQEDPDSVSIAGGTFGSVGDTFELTAELAGVDGGGATSYSWELVEGVAALENTTARTVTVRTSELGRVRVKVSAGDGVCVDEAAAFHTITVLGGAPGQSPRSGLVSYWPFDETLDDLADEFPAGTGVSLDALTPQGGGVERFVDGVRDGALAIGMEVDDPSWLDAMDSEDVNLPETYTIECWIFPTELSDSWQRLVLRWGSNGLSYHFAIRNNGANLGGEPNVNAVSLFHGEADGGQPNANGGTVIAREWQHIAGVADGEMLRVYLNGEEVDAVPYDGTILRDSGEPLGLADSATSISAITYNGLVDELAMWNVALTPAQIRSHYEAGSDGYGLDSEGGPLFYRGDPDDGGSANITDAISVLNFLFAGGAEPVCLDSADVNNDDAVNITDPVNLLNFLFASGAAPAPPGHPRPDAECGEDTGESLGCVRYTSC